MSDPGPTVPDPEPTASAAPAAERPSRGRSAAVVICLLLAALLTTPAGIAYWGQRTLNDTTRYVNTVGPQVDIEALHNDVFSGVITDRPRLQRLVGPLAAAINSLIDRQVREFLASDEFADLWTAVNTRAQQSLQRLLNGDQSGAVQLQGDQVVLDVSEVIERVKQRLVDRGLTIVQNIPIPNVDKQIVLLEAPQLKQLKNIYALANPLAQWLIVVVAGLYLAALVLARRRPRTTVVIGAALAANALLLALAISVGRQLFSDALAGTVFGPASRVFYNTLLVYLDRGRQVMLWLGLILIVVGWFAGANKYGSAVRGTVRGGLENIGGSLADGPVGNAGRWVAPNAGWLRVVAGLVGAVVLLWGNNMSVSRLFWSLVLVVGLLAVVQVLVGAGRSASQAPPMVPGQAVPGAAK
jgi:hypothetical protein